MWEDFRWENGGTVTAHIHVDCETRGILMASRLHTRTHAGALTHTHTHTHTHKHMVYT